MSEIINTLDQYDDTAVLDALIAHEQKEYIDDQLTRLWFGAFKHNYNIEKVILPNATNVTTNFENDWRLKEVDLRSDPSMVQDMFVYNVMLNKLNLATANSLGYNAFQRASTLETLAIDSVTSVSANVGMYSGPAAFDIPNKIVFDSASFGSNTNLCSIILRNSEMSVMSNTTLFDNTPIKSGYGYIYVPSSLVNTYKSATNWSSIASQIVSIDEYPKITFGTISDSWSQIFEAEENGTYSTKYSIGDTKVVRIGNLLLPMVIAAFDEDDLADDSGKAKITWLTYGMPYYTPIDISDEGTGWGGCYLREFLNDAVYPYIDPVVRNKIQLVHKPYYKFVSGNTSEVIMSDDVLWVPSIYEYKGSSFEETGADYHEFFQADQLRLSRHGGAYATDASASSWWTRTQQSGSAKQYRSVGTNGGVTGNSVGSSYNYVVFGFCT